VRVLKNEKHGKEKPRIIKILLDDTNTGELRCPSLVVLAV
jgi:hypothetical protein